MQSDAVYMMRILERHLDTFGHVNNATVLEILEEARWDFITNRGYSLEHIQKTGFGPIILEINIRYKREMRLREVIKISTKTTKVEKKIVWLHQEIHNEKGDLMVEAELVSGLFDLKERKLVAPTQEWLKAVAFTE